MPGLSLDSLLYSQRTVVFGKSCATASCKLPSLAASLKSTDCSSALSTGATCAVGCASGYKPVPTPLNAVTAFVCIGGYLTAQPTLACVRA